MENEGGGFFTQKFMGIPAWVFLAGAAVIAYLYFRNKSSASGNPPSTSGGGGRVSTGKTVLRPHAITVNVGDTSKNGGGGGGGGGHGPKPPVHYHGPVRAITVPRDETAGMLWSDLHWSEETIGDVEGMIQPKGTLKGQTLGPDTPLKKGDTIYRPIGRGKKEENL